MTDQELHGIARQALNMARTERELTGKMGMVLAWYRSSQDPPLYRMRLIEGMLAAKLGRAWLDSEGRKDKGFYMLRLATEVMQPEAVAISTATNMYRSTKKGTALFLRDGRKLDPRSNTPEGRRAMVEEGLLELIDSYTATVQTPQRVCMVCQPVDRGVFTGEAQTQFFDQDEFDGRGKMYGGELSDKDREEGAAYREALIKAGIGGLA